MGENMKYCKMCGKAIPKTRRGNAVYCSEKCLRRSDVSNVYKRVADTGKKGNIAKELYDRYGYKCAICGWQATPDLIKTDRGYMYSHGNALHHITPVENGGQAKDENLILLCPNHHKQADMGIITPEELKKYYIAPPTADELEIMKNRASDMLAKAIFG